jgi:hypothetical protein|tara:strand:+ start:692 stop:907 length:216 start_codon:yes stop_codon:yes gene_type:complete
MACKKCKKNKPLLSDRFNSSTEDIRKNISDNLLNDTFGEFSFLENFSLIFFVILPIVIGYVSIVRFFISVL